MKNSKNGKGKRRNSRHKRSTQDRTPTFTQDDIVSKADLEAGNNLMKRDSLKWFLLERSSELHLERT